MNKGSIIEAFAKLGNYMASGDAALEAACRQAQRHNPWFTPEHIRQALNAVAEAYLNSKKLADWSENYDQVESTARTVGVVAAGNIPLVAFHDILCVLVSGNRLLLKPAGKDLHLLPHLLEKIVEIQPELEDRIQLAERLSGMDAVIATGSNNSARYFEYYFRDIPHVIRKNRNSIAVLNGDESDAALQGLGHDVFDYFGLGCRNVSKLWLPEGYDLDRLRPAFAPFAHYREHNSYCNNLDYNRTLLMLNSIPFVDIDHVNLTANPMIPSPISNLHYEFYGDLEQVHAEVTLQRDQLQCIAGDVSELCTVQFGETQRPGLGDYADNIDTMAFLTDLPVKA